MLEHMNLIAMFNGLWKPRFAPHCHVQWAVKTEIRSRKPKAVGTKKKASAGSYDLTPMFDALIYDHSHQTTPIRSRKPRRSFVPGNPDSLQKTSISNRKKGGMRGIGRITKKNAVGRKKGQRWNLWISLHLQYAEHRTFALGKPWFGIGKKPKGGDLGG